MLSRQTEPVGILCDGLCGAGLRAGRHLPEGTVVTRFEGPVVEFAAVPESEIRYAILLEGVRWMLPGTDARLLNHSCDPNCRVLDSLEVATVRNVAAGEDLTISYNTVEPWERRAFFAHPENYFWDSRWTFECRCGSAACRGRIDGYYLRPEPPRRIGFAEGKGRGVFAIEPYGAGAIVERAPVIVAPAGEWPHLERTALYDYSYSWGAQLEHAAICLGYGSLYNHSYDPNMIYRRLLESLEIEFVARRPIARGEELTVNYNGDPEDRQPLWFAAR